MIVGQDSKIMQWFLQEDLISDNTVETGLNRSIAILCEPVFSIVVLTEHAARLI